MSIGIASWAVFGVALLVGRALFDLAPLAVEAVVSGALELSHWAVLTAWVAFNTYAEGYVGFHRKFSPRVVKRAMALGRNPTLLRVALAAPYCMGLFHAPRRIVLSSWILVFVIAAAVFGVRLLPQPWRGIIDAGVVAGLGIGLLSLLGHFAAALGHPHPSPEEC